jgi:hypothetical protein
MNRRQFVFTGSSSIIAAACHLSAQGNNVPAAGLHAVQPPTDFPDFSLPDVGGKTIQRSDLLGKVLILRFWATW